MQPPHFSRGGAAEPWQQSGRDPPLSAPAQTWPVRPQVRSREAPGSSRSHKGGLPSIPSSESLEQLRGAMARVQAAQAHPEHRGGVPPPGFREFPDRDMPQMPVPSPLEVMQMRQAAAAMAAAKYASRQAEGLIERGGGGGRGLGESGGGGGVRSVMDGMAISPAALEERQRQWMMMQQHQQAMLQHRLHQQQQGQVGAHGKMLGGLVTARNQHLN
jgi:hypothetical protein